MEVKETPSQVIDGTNSSEFNKGGAPENEYGGKGVP